MNRGVHLHLPEDNKISTQNSKKYGFQQFCRFALYVFSLFLPVTKQVGFLIAGNILYLIGLICSTTALIQFSKASLDQAITTGIYKHSRHPMQVFSWVMYLGIAVLAQNIMFCGLIAVHIALSISGMKMQEQYCFEKYGDEYDHYKNKTPFIMGVK